MIVHLVGIGSETFTEFIDLAGIDYKLIHPPVGEPQNGGSVLELLVTALGPVSVVLVAWLNTRPTRKAIVRTKDDVVIHVEGRSIKEVGELLDKAASIMVMDTCPKKKKH